MRFSSVPSVSSDLEGYTSSDDLNFATLISDDLSPPHSTKYTSQTQQFIHPQLQIRNYMFGREDDWMRPSEFDFGYDFSEAPASQEQYYSSGAYNEPSQSYGEQWYSQQQQQGTSGYSQYYQPQYLASHRRFASSSSAASSAEHQLSRHPSLSYQQYPSTQTLLSPYQNQQTSWSYDTSSPLSGTQHLPTPVGTPKSDASFSVPNPRRSRPTTGRDAALAAAHNSVRSALNQTWSPNTYTQLQTQSRLPYSDMPRTPQSTVDESDAQRAAAPTVPKFDRTVSDAQADELYNPATLSQSSYTAPRPQPPTSSYVPAQPSVLRDRLRDANEARSSSPSQVSGQASPWRNSPYGDNASQYNTQNMPMQTAQAMRERQKAESEAHEMQQHHQKRDVEEPKTISPKDAFPEQQMSKEDEQLPSLFPTDSNQSTSSNPRYAPIGSSQEFGPYTSAPSQPSFTFASPGMPASHALDFREYYQRQFPNAMQYGPVNGDLGYPATLTSMETTKSEDSEALERSSPEDAAEHIERPSPSERMANGGQYTCPYSDNQGICGARFDNAGDLNKHKRDVHRPTGTLASSNNNNNNNNSTKRATAMTQTGPHKCTRINPSTNKPCNTVFSRPYDLTRHEDTIHGEGKKLRCPHCPEEKLFSRNDALTRHLKVVHNSNQTPPPSKQQRGRRQGT